jgi:type II secretory pathway pseudopilin PulG
MSIRRTTTRRPSHRRAGFTLTELVVVIGLIVLFVTIAIPAFSIITGGRSIDSAQNQVSAILGRARADAVGLQEERGVFFYQETPGGRYYAAIVRARSDVSQNTTPVALDLLPDREQLALPTGVGVQTILNANINASGQRTTDGYLGANYRIQGWGPTYPAPTGTATAVGFGGVILFDANGRLENKPYLFVISEPDANLKPQWTQLGRLLMGIADNDTSTKPTGAPQYIGTSRTPTGPMTELQYSQVGFTLFDETVFNSSGFTDADPAVDGGATAYAPPPSASPEAAEELWIDANSTPFLVNRYNGTLMRGE